ncbi:MAG: WYL domain-containing protein [Acidobacteria bacterium]|nr:WYL domain-containing protein [Acidobacteriota bacterium]MBI3657492.1 WYL domain-containing protein [Acidobacteriota bacterium]
MSHRGKLTERLVEIPLLLAERRRSLREMAEHFRVSRKIIKRAIDTLTFHYPIADERDGREVYYRFSEGYKYRSPVFTPGEVATLLLAEESIAVTGLTAISSPLAGYARSLLAKVRASLPPSLREKLDALAVVFGSAAAPAKDFSRHATTIDRLVTAAVERRRVRLRYYTLNTDRVAERTVEPYAVYFDPDGATLKLIGYDHLRKTILPFAIDHIRFMRLTDEHFTRPADFDLRELLAVNCFNGIHGKPIDVRLRAHEVTARIFAERTFHRTQRLVERTPHAINREETTTLEMRVASGRGLVRFILSWGPDVEVLSPPELRREVAETHRRARARYADHE